MDSRAHPGALDVERAVRELYSKGAQEQLGSLCCPIPCDPKYLKAIPREVLDRDYGCGDPSRYVREGDVVLDLGSGGGKICFIASQIAGPSGRVIGVDVNEEMLELARRSTPFVAGQIGYSNVTFHRGRIQDLRLDMDLLEEWLREHPIRRTSELSGLEDFSERLRRERQMITDCVIDIVISNCVLNLVRDSDKRALITEIFRVLKVGGRIAICDIVSDQPVPEEMKADPELWSGCVSGAFQEGELLRELEQAGFYGIAIDAWSEQPYKVMKGIEFRSVTITARKGKEGEANQAVIYKGPWKVVEDDDRHVLRRGERTAVCAKTFNVLTSEPYTRDIVPVPPRVEIPEAERKPFDCSRTTPRHPKESDGQAYTVTTENAGACCPPGCC